MTKSYEVLVSMTGKTIGKNEPYQMFDREIKSFSSIKEVKDWLAETYGKAKKQKMFIDSSVGGLAEHSGYIYHFRDKDWSHNEPEYLREDWIEVYEVKRKRVVLN
jgi:hypothetical protein